VAVDQIGTRLAKMLSLEDSQKSKHLGGDHWVRDVPVMLKRHNVMKWAERKIVRRVLQKSGRMRVQHSRD
jgi:hypothetical protein